MKSTSLSTVAQIFMGQSPPSSSYNKGGQGLPFFQGKADFGDLYPEVRVFCKNPLKVAEVGDILISVRAPVGPTNINPEKACIGRGLAALRCRNPFDTKYLLYFLRFYEPKWAKISTGSTFDAISRDDLENIQVPVPAPSEQKRIGTILEKADRLRLLHRYAMELSSTYLQTVFLEMFSKNADNNWPHERIESLAKSENNAIRTGPFGSQLLHSEFVDEGIAVLGIDNAVQNRFVWDKRRFITEEKYQQLKRYKVFPGDVIITIMGTPGRCAVIPANIALAINTKHLCCITLDQNKCLPTYLQSCFLIHPSVLRQLNVSEHGAVMPGLNMEIIKELIIPCPPLPLQQKFAQIVQKHERIQTQQREALRQAEHLFQALLRKAFQGELAVDQNEVLMPDVEVANQQTSVFADVIKPINTDSYQLALPLE